MKILKRVAQLLGLALVVVCLAHIGAEKGVAPQNYDFKQTSVKIMGAYGHGSGAVIDSTDTESLILTNKHVCEGIADTAELKKSLEIVNYMLFNAPECTTFKCLTKSDRENGPLLFKVFLTLESTRAESVLKQFEKDPTNPVNLQKAIQAGINAAIQVKFMNLPRENAGASIIAVSPEVDLCLIKVQVGNLPVLKIANKKPSVGTKVQTIGNPHDAENHMVDGYVGNDKRIWGDMYTLITAPIFPGQSGSATVNMQGELVGVNTLSDLRAASIGYMIPLEDIKMFIFDKMLFRVINMQI